MDDLVEFQSQVRLSDSTPLSDLFATGSGKSYGGEFLLRKTEGRLKGWVGYTLSKTEHTFAALNQGNPFPQSTTATRCFCCDGLLSGQGLEFECQLGLWHGAGIYASRGAL